MKNNFTEHDLKMIGMRQQITKGLKELQSDGLRKNVKFAIYRGINVTIGQYDGLLETSGVNLNVQADLLSDVQSGAKKIKIAQLAIDKLINVLEQKNYGALADGDTEKIAKNVILSATRNFKTELGHRLKYCDLLLSAVSARFEADPMNVDVAKEILQIALNKNNLVANTDVKMKYCHATAKLKLAEARSKVAVAALKGFESVYKKSSGQLTVPTKQRKLDTLVKLAMKVIKEDHVISSSDIKLMVAETNLNGKVAQIQTKEQEVLESMGFNMNSPQFLRANALKNGRLSKADSDIKNVSPNTSPYLRKKEARNTVKKEDEADKAEVKILQEVMNEVLQDKKPTEMSRRFESFFDGAVAENMGTKQHLDIMISLESGLSELMNDLPKMYFDLDEAKVILPKTERRIAQQETNVNSLIQFATRPEVDHEANKEFIAALKNGDGARAYDILKGDDSIPLVIRTFDPSSSESYMTNVEMGKMQEKVFEKYPELGKLLENTNIGKVKIEVEESAEYRQDPDLVKFLKFYSENATNVKDFTSDLEALSSQMRAKQEFENTITQLGVHIPEHSEANEENPSGVVSIGNTQNIVLTLADKKYEGAEEAMMGELQRRRDAYVDMAITNDTFGESFNFNQYKSFLKEVKPEIGAMKQIDEINEKEVLEPEDKVVLKECQALLDKNPKLAGKLVERCARILQSNQGLLAEHIDAQGNMGDKMTSVIELKYDCKMSRALHSQINETRDFINDNGAVNDSDLSQEAVSSLSAEASVPGQTEKTSNEAESSSLYETEDSPPSPGRSF